MKCEPISKSVCQGGDKCNVDRCRGVTRLTRCECPWQCTWRWRASDDGNRLCVDQHRGGPAASSNKEDRKFTMTLSKAHKKNEHPKTVNGVLNIGAPQYLHHNMYRKWHLALGFFFFPYLRSSLFLFPMCPFSNTCSCFPLCALWMLLTKPQGSPHALLSTARMKVRAEMKEIHSVPLPKHTDQQFLESSVAIPLWVFAKSWLSVSPGMTQLTTCCLSWKLVSPFKRRKRKEKTKTEIKNRCLSL